MKSWMRRFSAVCMVTLVLVALVAAAAPAAQAPAAIPALAPAVTEPALQSGAIRDIVRQFEIWEQQGIRFVVRDASGQVVTWGVGRLESWDGTRTVMCVRSPKGTFLTWAKGRIESWKGGAAMRYVFRDRKGHFLQWAPLELTSAASFGENLARLFRTSPGKTKHFALLLEVVHESIVADLRAGRTEKAFRFASAAFAHTNDPAQCDKIAAVLKPVLAWLKPQALHAPADSQLADLYQTCSDLANMTM